MTLNFSLGEWPFLMRASIFEGKERALDVEQGNFLALDVHELGLARCNLVHARHFHKFGHAPVLTPKATIAVTSPSMTAAASKNPLPGR